MIYYLREYCMIVCMILCNFAWLFCGMFLDFLFISLGIVNVLIHL